MYDNAADMLVAALSHFFCRNDREQSATLSLLVMNLHARVLRVMVVGVCCPYSVTRAGTPDCIRGRADVSNIARVLRW